MAGREGLFVRSVVCSAGGLGAHHHRGHENGEAREHEWQAVDSLLREQEGHESENRDRKGENADCKSEVVDLKRFAAHGETYLRINGLGIQRLRIDCRL